MGTTNVPGQLENRSRKRLLMPLLVPLLVILFLFALRTHKRLSQNTVISFQVTMEGEAVSAEVLLDESPYAIGSRVPLGNHQITVKYVKGQTFTTNLFVFYGERNLGAIDLKRARGVLAFTVIPRAQILEIRSDDFQTNVANVSNFSGPLPTGDYVIRAVFKHHEEKRAVSLSARGMLDGMIRAPIGSVEINSNQRDTTFTVVGKDGRTIEEGSLPVIINDVAAGAFDISVTHHNRTWSGTANIETGKTNRVSADFNYAAISLQSNPEGADVVTNDGQVLGKTPLLVSELDEGEQRFLLRLPSYDPVPVTTRLKAGETNSFKANLVRTGYLQAMQAARRFVNNKQFDAAGMALAGALDQEPTDPDAQAMMREVKRQIGFREAEFRGNLKNFKAAIAHIEDVLKVFPDDERAKTLLSAYREKDAEKTKQDQKDRLDLAKTLLAFAQSPDAEMFETHKISTKKPVASVEKAISDILKIGPEYKVMYRRSGLTNGFTIKAEHEFLTALATVSGRRNCIIVGAQVTDEETEVLFKIWEYKTEAVNKFSIGNAIGAPAEVNFVLIKPANSATTNDKLQARVREGISDLTARVKRATE
jgi:hypothetical protein